MIDLHTHSLLSDGELIPSELVRRAAVKGYTAIAVTDHADHSNIDVITHRMRKVNAELTAAWGIKVIPGVELTHVPPALICELAKEAKSMGAAVVVVHGETLVEPVQPGTNFAAMNKYVDILAHPGLISIEEAKLAAELGICLEISARKGHCLANGHVAKVASIAGAKLILNTDTHSPSDLISYEEAEKIVLGAGLTPHDFIKMLDNSREISERAL